ncbi:MAG TPA: type IV toxin-antitoxin system AbiEi family antitoxin [Candidatus Limnocylindrales bacterium]|nr:type IV toxin-antitoxin system AbiEi family antitoxin [Candidatus Limnocylindrales bacterium]
MQHLAGLAFRPVDVQGLADRAALERLVRAGFIRRARHGLYEIVEQPLVSLPSEMVLALAGVPSAEEPYISWRSALVFHGLTEQLPRAIFIAVRKPRRSRRVGGARVQYVVQVDAKRYDVITAPLTGASIRVATREKAVLDCLDRPELSGGLPEIVRALSLRGQLDLNHLLDLALRYPSDALVRRLGFLLEALGLTNAKRLLKRVSPQDKPLLLDLEGLPDGEINQRWRVRDNVGRDEISDWTDL